MSSMAGKATDEGANVGDVLYTYGERESVARAMGCINKKGCTKHCKRTEATQIQHMVSTENVGVLNSWRVACGKCRAVV
jgi:hypothetical protein